MWHWSPFSPRYDLIHVSFLNLTAVISGWLLWELSPVPVAPCLGLSYLHVFLPQQPPGRIVMASCSVGPVKTSDAALWPER